MRRPCVSTLWPAVGVLLALLAPLVRNSSAGGCERITVPLCEGVPYNYTRLPNMLGDHDQQGIALDVRTFAPLVRTGCSPHIRFFVCSIYTPMCVEEVEVALTSCRSVCEQVKLSCAPVLTRFGLTWPEMLSCDRFPKEGEQPCIEPEAGYGAAGGRAPTLRLPPADGTATTRRPDVSPPPAVGADIAGARGASTPAPAYYPPAGRCERIRVPLCEDGPYNYTRLPNMLGHSDQEMIAMDIRHFEPLMHTGCSPHVRFFVCSVYAPMCMVHVDIALTSCKSVCEEVKSSCMPILKRFGLTWPDMLSCDRFPGVGELCIEPRPGSGLPNMSCGKK